MLQSIRNRSKGVFAWIILILICIPFLFWGIQNYIDGGEEQPVAVVGDMEFFQGDVTRAYQTMASGMGELGQFDESTLRILALKNLIDQEVLQQAVLDQGYVVGDGQIREAINQMPYFRGENGFDKDKYESGLRAQGMSEAYFIAQMRQRMRIGQLRNGVTGSAFSTAAELERFLNLRDQKRTIEYVKISLAESNSELTASEIEVYYREHESSFLNTEQVSVEYIELAIDNLGKKLEISDEALLGHYEAQQDLFTRKERRKVSHILAAVNPQDDPEADAVALRKIQTAQEALENGESFALVAEKFSDDSVSGKQGGDLGLINRGEMDKEFEKVAFALDLDGISDIVKTGFGYHLVKVTELEAGEVKLFATVRGEVEKSYRRQQAENTFYELGESLAQISYENPDSLVPAAENAGLEIKLSELFTSNEQEGFGANKKIVEAAFSEQVLEGKNSDPIEVAADRVMVLRIKEHRPATVKRLDEVRGQVVAQIRIQKAMDGAKDQASDLMDALKNGKSLSDLARSNQLTLHKPGATSRGDDKAPGLLIQAVFKAAKLENGQPIPIQVALPTGEQLIAVLLEVQNGVLNGQVVDEKEKDMAIKWLTGQAGNAEFSDLLDQLREDTEISILEDKQ
jgi:peptidyl-prolyl cis-trans isomerase D